jgi:hypothetical protein
MQWRNRDIIEKTTKMYYHHGNDLNVLFDLKDYGFVML